MSASKMPLLTNCCLMLRQEEQARRGETHVLSRTPASVHSLKASNRVTMLTRCCSQGGAHKAGVDPKMLCSVLSREERHAAL